MWQSGKFGCQYLIKHYEMLIFKTRSSFKVSKKKKILHQAKLAFRDKLTINWLTKIPWNSL